MSDDDTQVGVKMPEHLRDAVMRELPHGKFSEEVRNLAQRLAFGEEIAEDDALRAELENTRAEIDEIDTNIERLQVERSELSKKVKRLEKRVDQQSKRQQKFIGKLEMLEDELRGGSRVLPDSKPVGRVADTGAVSVDVVIEKLQKRNPEIPEYAFQDGLHDDKSWDGVESSGSNLFD